jgi:hypothetical protein
VSALERPSEVLLVAFFDSADRAEAAARAFLHSGLDADHVATLARESRGTALEAVPRSAFLRMRGVGRAVARGALATELGHGSVALGTTERLATALRRLGLSVTDAPRLARAVRADLILVLAAVPREEALGWGRLLQAAGAVSLTARPRLRRWPPTATAGVGRRHGTTPSVAPLRRSRRFRREPDEGPWWDGTAS